jgi:sec-independent protein translocase protein TatA
MLGTWEIILIVLVILLIFGGKKIPELMKGLGKGVKSFKDGVNGKEDSEEKSNSEQSERSNSEAV